MSPTATRMGSASKGSGTGDCALTVAANPSPVPTPMMTRSTARTIDLIKPSLSMGDPSFFADDGSFEAHVILSSQPVIRILNSRSKPQQCALNSTPSHTREGECARRRVAFVIAQTSLIPIRRHTARRVPRKETLGLRVARGRDRWPRRSSGEVPAAPMRRAAPDPVRRPSLLRTADAGSGRRA
jgi:hypothetical protein